MNTTKKKFSWLHLSDLHAGMDTQAWLWPNLKERFFEDLERIYDTSGGWDLVIFSGDLTQNGSTADYIVLNAALNELWEKFDKLGCKPQLFAVPGNHDLSRPEETDPVAIALQSWWSNNLIRENFWKSNNNPYREFITKLFNNFSIWKEQLSSNGIPIAQNNSGILPGDCSAIVQANGMQVGLVGLNSAHLQIASSGAFGKLDADIRQLMAVTDNQPDVWCRKNDLNFLVTHHPISWLEERAQRHFQEEIYPPARFTAHFFGHMHKPEIGTYSNGGSLDRRIIQAASLYGLRKINGAEHDRIHGYSAGRALVTNADGELTFWPRISSVVNSGTRRFVADTSFDLTESNNFVIRLKVGPESSHGSQFVPTAEPELFQPPGGEHSTLKDQQDIVQGGYLLQAALHHLLVRRVEQDKVIDALNQNQEAWLVADWGYGTDEFLWTTLIHEQNPAPLIFRLDLDNYNGKEQFLERIVDQTGCSFQQFCKLIAGSKKSYLILDNAPVARESILKSREWQDEIIDIVRAIREYCINVSVILISRLVPEDANVPIVELSPFDEPDLRSYLMSHPNGGTAFGDANTALEIYRLSGGLPVQIDSILNQLRWMTLSDVIESHISNHDTLADTQEIGSGVIQAVEELRNSSDPITQRAHLLLTALTCFPYGETLNRIKRFYPDAPFFPAHVQVLLDRGLIEIQIISNKFHDGSTLEQPKKIIAKKAARDYRQSTLDPIEKFKLYGLAASIYFGKDWANGKPKSIKTADLVTSLGGEGGLCNPEAIINFLISHAIQNADPNKLQSVIRLAKLFASNLESNDYFRSTVTACRTFLLSLHDADEKYNKDKEILNFYLAKSLRMSRQYEEAKDIFFSLENARLDKTMRQRVLLNLALSLKEDPERQSELAQEVIKLGKTTGPALHAKALLLQLDKDDPDQLKKLFALEATARAKKAITVANNIAVYCANNAKGPVNDRRVRLRKIAHDARLNGDPYSAATIAINAARLGSKSPEGISNEELSSLVQAYHYLYSERIGNLFEDCHKILWNHFESRGDITNLLRLFRHSSFIWRISGQEPLEKDYLGRLITIYGGNEPSNVLTADQETAYFAARARRLTP